LRVGPLAAAALLALAPAAARAAVTAYTERAAFDAAIAGYGDLRVLDFEGVAAGTLVPSGSALDGVSFDYSIGAFQLQVTDAFAASSGTRSLGLDADDALLAGDAFSMDFDRVVHAVGVYAIGADLLAGDFELRLPGGASVANGATPDVALADGAAFFLGRVESDPDAGFASVELASLATGGADFTWNADDVVSAVAVPEPGAAAGAATLALALRARRRGGLTARAAPPLRPAPRGCRRGR